MIDKNIVDNIRDFGTCVGNANQKTEMLSQIGFPIGKPAEYVIIAGCFQPLRMPEVLKTLKNVLDHFGVSYTILRKEYCCTWGLLGRTAVMSKNEEDIARSKHLSREFIIENFRQAKTLGAKSVVLFCSACEPAYSNVSNLTDMEIISQYELLDRYFNKGKLKCDVDYYAGCYRFRRRMTDRPLDIKPALNLLDKIEGLKVNHLDNNLCCYIPPLMDKLTASIKTHNEVNICTGCYHSLKEKLKEKDHIKVTMLVEIIWQAIANENSLV
jgi:hypothetical protein